MTKNGILLTFSIYKNSAIEFINNILDHIPFQPSKMDLALVHKKTKYNKSIFIETFETAINDNKRCNSRVFSDFKNSISFRYDNFSYIVTIILRSSILTDDDSITELFDSIIRKQSIIVAYFRDKLDGSLRIDTNIDYYESVGIDTSKLRIIKDQIMNRDILDIEQFSGHSHEYGGIEFTSTYLMWFGKDFFRFVPQETLTSFKECVSNETFDNGTVRIQLYEDINDFNTAETDRRQWAFRKHTNIDKVAEEWNKEYLAMASKDKSGANMTFENGHFEHGGVKLVKLYLDKDNNTTTKKHAVKVKCVEYDSAGNVVFDDILSV